MSLQVWISLACAVAAVVAQTPAANNTPPLAVNTPQSAQSCLPLQLTWGGGRPPYYVSLIPGGQPGAPILKDFGQQTNTNLTWNVDQPAGTPVSIMIRDSTGTINYSDKISVQPSSQTCEYGTSSPVTNSSATTPTNGSSNTGKQGGTTSGSTSNTTPPAPGSSGSPASNGAASSDASRNIPGFIALGLAALTAVFV